MNVSRLGDLARSLVAIAFLFSTTVSLAAPRAAAVLTLQYQQSEHKSVNLGQPLFGHYLGTGSGVATGSLQGEVAWDLYEDQSRDDLHPALFRGLLEHNGERYPFQIIGVFTPHGEETAHSPDGRAHPRHWTLSGTIVFEQSRLLGVRHAPVTGAIDLSVSRGSYTVWVDPVDIR